MQHEMDPLDPTGLNFSGDGSAYHKSTREFTVSGFRDKDHAQAWADAYYKRAMGYGPHIRIKTDGNNYSIDVSEFTSCD
jgi:hypothetical protein